MDHCYPGSIHDIARHLTENWVNGNRAFVLAEICDRMRDSAKTALLSVLIFRALSDNSWETANEFARQLANKE